MHKIFESEIAVRPDDIDVNQHVHFTKYLDFMLAARYDQMKKDYKMSMEEFVNRGLNWFIKSFKVEYKRALKMGDIAIVKTQIESYNGATVVVNYWIYKKGETKIYVEGQAEFVLLSIQTGRPVRIPDDILQIYSV